MVDIGREWADLREALRECAEDLSATGDDGRPLRRLQGRMRKLLTSPENQVRTLAFILDSWISDYFYNFAGDMPSEGSDEVAVVRKGFLQDTAVSSLSIIASGEDGNAHEGQWRGVTQLIGSYLAALDTANKAL